MAAEIENSGVSASTRLQAKPRLASETAKSTDDVKRYISVGRTDFESDTKAEKVQLIEVATQIQNFLRENVKGDLRVQMDETLNRPVIKILDTKTNTEFSIPSETAIRIAQSVDQMRGYFFDGKA